jgi:hypothetical protein
LDLRPTNTSFVVSATSNCTRYTPRMPSTSAYIRIPSGKRLTPAPAFFLVMDIENRMETPKMVLPKRKRPLPPVPSGPPAIPREVRARLAAPESPKGTSLGNGNEVGAYNCPKFCPLCGCCIPLRHLLPGHSLFVLRPSPSLSPPSLSLPLPLFLDCYCLPPPLRVAIAACAVGLALIFASSSLFLLSLLSPSLPPPPN